MSDTHTPGGASLASFGYLESLWMERTDEPFPTEKFSTRDQLQVSALIESVLERPALPTISASLMDEIQQLAVELGESYEPKDRGQASRIVRQLRKRVNRKKFTDARATAKAELDELLVPAF